jgi:uracil-DNA glycosylase
LWERVPAGWRAALDGQQKLPYWQKIESALNADAAAGKVIYPPVQQIFRALELCSNPDNVRVVISGQDPYPGEDEAEGLCFSVARGVSIPSSLRNIFKELSTDVDGYKMPSHGSLEAWARQGVLLLNTSLTVRHGKPRTHSAIGWTSFTEAVLRAVAQRRRNQGVVVFAWGQHAQRAAAIFSDYLPDAPDDGNAQTAAADGKTQTGAVNGKTQTGAADESRHVVLSAAHPSGRSAHAGWFDCAHFSRCNQFLVDRGLSPIDWQT